MGGLSGEEKDESRDRSDSSWSGALPGSANSKELLAMDACGEASWFWWAWRLVGLVSVCLRLRKGVGSPRKSNDCWLAIDLLPLSEARGVVDPPGEREASGDGILTGKGKSELRFLFLRGSLKNVVCVDTV